ncbi:MAG: amidohydrolase family protein [Candidatus Binatia bacterium]
MTPGWVDVHTHYDGQVTWDLILAPSSWNGVTTLVMGNCGAGFAPRRPRAGGVHRKMEGVEDILGTACTQASTGAGSRSPNTSTRSPPCRACSTSPRKCRTALRAYVLGERAHEDEIDAGAIAAMARLTEEAMRAGAGFPRPRAPSCTSRGTAWCRDALDAGGVAGAGQRPRRGRARLRDGRRPAGTGADLSWMNSAAAPAAPSPSPWRRRRCSRARTLARVEQLAAEGLKLAPQVPCRPTGMLYGLQSSLHPFISHPTYAAELAPPPLAERADRLVHFRARPPPRRGADHRAPDRPLPDQQLAGDLPARRPARLRAGAGDQRRRHRGARRPAARGGGVRLDAGARRAAVPVRAAGQLRRRQLRRPPRDDAAHPRSVLGLSDGGAHCGLICDASMPTYLLTHWARDRRRGARIPLEQVVRLQTGNTAAVYGFTDRGTLAVGKKADLNVIDHDALRLHAPEMVFDLPGGGRRLVQRVVGYRCTVVSGVVTFEDGEPTGARPGALVRGHA